MQTHSATFKQNVFHSLVYYVMLHSVLNVFQKFTQISYPWNNQRTHSYKQSEEHFVQMFVGNQKSIKCELSGRQGRTVKCTLQTLSHPNMIYLFVDFLLCAKFNIIKQINAIFLKSFLFAMFPCCRCVLTPIV